MSTPRHAPPESGEIPLSLAIPFFLLALFFGLVLLAVGLLGLSELTGWAGFEQAARFIAWLLTPGLRLLSALEL